MRTLKDYIGPTCIYNLHERVFPPLTLGNMQMIKVLIALLPCPIIIPVVIGKQATFILFTKAELESNNGSIVTLP